MSARSRGFTLIELVMIIVLLGVGGTAILSLFGNVARSLDDNQDTQTGIQLVQECAEYIMAFRRSTDPARGYAGVAIGVNTGQCNAAFTAVSGFTTAPQVDVVGRDSGSLPACPSVVANSCKQVTMRINKGGQVMAQATLMLVQ